MIELTDCLETIEKNRTDEVLIASMSSIYLWHYVSKHDADLTFTDPMGGASGLALGVALGRPDVGVFLIQGDGSLLMYPGALVTIAETAPANLVIFLMNNGVYAVPEHPIPGAGKVDFCGLARAAGIQRVYDFNTREQLDAAIPKLKGGGGPHFVVLRTTSKISPRDFKEDHRARPQAVKRFGRSGVRSVRAYLDKVKPRTV